MTNRPTSGTLADVTRRPYCAAEYRFTDLGLTRKDLLRIAVEADCDPRSVLRVLRFRLGQLPRGVRGPAAQRIERALSERGLLPALGGTAAA